MSGKKEKPPRSERGESIRAYFVRLFGKYDFRNEEQFLYFGKWLIFILLLLVEGLALLDGLDGFREKGGFPTFLGLLAVVVIQTIFTALQLFFVKKMGRKMVFCIFNAFGACSLFFFTDDMFSLVVYMLVLTQIYSEAKKTRDSILVAAISISLYLVVYSLRGWWIDGIWVWQSQQVVRQCLGFVLWIFVHFVVAQIALAFYRQYLKLDKALAELSESKKELEKAYAVVAEVTALEERQRIAKDIHDTAGHSLTTVIMQTESAKRILDSNPAEAKQKLIAANLQARHALEELRDSVHLLSGGSEQATLSDALLGIIHESTDGTGIIIRSEIDEVEVSPAKHRFLCNSLKEGISNGLRHGNATAFWFELKEKEGKIHFLLSDNGKGSGGALKLGFGLTTMQERAHALGGEATFLSDIEEGFEIRLQI